MAYEDLSIDFGRTNFRQKRDMECKLGLRALLEPAITSNSMRFTWKKLQHRGCHGNGSRDLGEADQKSWKKTVNQTKVKTKQWRKKSGGRVTYTNSNNRTFRQHTPHGVIFYVSIFGVWKCDEITSLVCVTCILHRHKCRKYSFSVLSLIFVLI